MSTRASDGQSEQKGFSPIAMDEKIEVEETIEEVKRRNYGIMIPIVIDAETLEPRYFLGPHFYVFVPTWFGSICLFIYIFSKLINQGSPWLLALSIMSCLNFLFFYGKTGLSSPGIASNSHEPDALTRHHQRYCIPCKIVRPLGTKHCYFCDVCIYNMDHHCPWVGKCIGRDNLCLFYKFLVSVFLLLGCLLVTALTASTGTTGPTVNGNGNGNGNITKL